jgi:hypothetical protein
MTAQELQPVAFSVHEATIVSGLGRTSIYEAMNIGLLPSRKFGRRRIILRSDLLAFLATLPITDGAAWAMRRLTAPAARDSASP